MAAKTNINQGTKEWIQKRRSLLGGSEVGRVIHARSWGSIIENKGRWIDNIYLRWGRRFEPIAVELFEKEYGVKVFDRNAYYADESRGFGYSPDGIFELGGRRYLLEVKCPATRELGKIPLNYQYQMEFGCHLLGIESAVYAEYKFAKCPPKLLDSQLCLDVYGETFYQDCLARGISGKMGWKLLKYQVVEHADRKIEDKMPVLEAFAALLPPFSS